MNIFPNSYYVPIWKAYGYDVVCILFTEVCTESGFYFVDRLQAAISFNPMNTNEAMPSQYSNVFNPSFVQADEGKIDSQSLLACF